MSVSHIVGVLRASLARFNRRSFAVSNSIHWSRQKCGRRAAAASNVDFLPIVILIRSFKMADQEHRQAILQQILSARRRRSILQQSILLHVLLRRRIILICCSLILLLLLSRENVTTPRSCQRLVKNTGWLDMILNTNSEKRFKKTFRVTKATFEHILSHIRPDLERNTVTELPISPRHRLGICLYRLARGDYNYSLHSCRNDWHRCINCFHKSQRGL